MSEKNKIKLKLIEKVRNNKKLQYVLIISLVLLIIVIYAVSGLIKSNSNKVINSASVVSDLESRLTETLNKVEGAGKVSVVINVESGMQTVLAMKTIVTENSSGKTVEESPLIVNGETVTIKELYPEITGVLIVAEGADNIVVYRKLQQATTSLLNVNVNKIEILKMK